MVGYQGRIHLGWFSARLEDGLTWLPCRLVLTLALMSGRHVWRLCRRDAIKDPSQFQLGAYAAVLGVQMGVYELVWWGS